MQTTLSTTGKKHTSSPAALSTLLATTFILIFVFLAALPGHSVLMAMAVYSNVAGWAFFHQGNLRSPATFFSAFITGCMVLGAVLAIYMALALFNLAPIQILAL